MLINRTTFFVTLFLALLIPLLGSKIIWLTHSEKTQGIVAFEGKGNAGDQIRLDYSVIWFRYKEDTIWFNGFGNLRLPPGTPIPIRYQAGNPTDAKVDIFPAIWGDTLVYGGIPLLMLICVFLHPDVVPRRSRLCLSYKRPFIRIV